MQASVAIMGVHLLVVAMAEAVMGMDMHGPAAALAAPRWLAAGEGIGPAVVDQP